MTPIQPRQKISTIAPSSVVTADHVRTISYPDFVGFVNQWNVLPGAYSTINKWATFSRVTRQSHVLQVACTTGFQSRELALLTECSGQAFDVSDISVEMAIYNRSRYAPNVDIKYFQADCYEYETDDRFSHLLVGGGLRFFHNPELALSRCIRFLKNDGYVLASPFWVNSRVPDCLIEQAQDAFGIMPTTDDYKTVMRLYKELEILYEERSEIPQETETELEEYCTATINRACDIRGIVDGELRNAMFDRLLNIRRTSNALRPFQTFSTLVLRYRQTTYPHRYVELF